MIVGYARVSTNAQADGEALDQQIARLKAAGAEDIFVDVESGRSVKRSRSVRFWRLALPLAIGAAVPYA